MAGAMGRFNYISDNGTTYAVSLDASNGVAVGNTVASSLLSKPGRTKMRYILAQHPTSGRERRVVICDPANAIWLGTTNTVSLPDFNAAMAATAFIIRGRIGERRLG
jgi:hypothetical protein